MMPGGQKDPQKGGGQAQRFKDIVTRGISHRMKKSIHPMTAYLITNFLQMNTENLMITQSLLCIDMCLIRERLC